MEGILVSAAAIWGQLLRPPQAITWGRGQGRGGGQLTPVLCLPCGPSLTTLCSPSFPDTSHTDKDARQRQPRRGLSGPLLGYGSQKGITGSAAQEDPAGKSRRKVLAPELQNFCSKCVAMPSKEGGDSLVLGEAEGAGPVGRSVGR